MTKKFKIPNSSFKYIAYSHTYLKYKIPRATYKILGGRIMLNTFIQTKLRKIIYLLETTQ